MRFTSPPLLAISFLLASSCIISASSAYSLEFPDKETQGDTFPDRIRSRGPFTEVEKQYLRNMMRDKGVSLDQIANHIDYTNAVGRRMEADKLGRGTEMGSFTKRPIDLRRDIWLELPSFPYTPFVAGLLITAVFALYIIIRWRILQSREPEEPQTSKSATELLVSLQNNADSTTDTQVEDNDA